MRSRRAAFSIDKFAKLKALNILVYFSKLIITLVESILWAKFISLDLCCGLWLLSAGTMMPWTGHGEQQKRLGGLWL